MVVDDDDDDDFDFLVLESILGILNVWRLQNDLNPLEEHEFELSLRKSFSNLGLRSIEKGFLCCTFM